MMRSTLDFAMGALYLGVGLLMFFPESIGIDMEGFDETIRKIFGGLCMIYGVWRLYRGVRKEY